MTVVAIARALDDGRIELAAPEPGLFRASVRLGDVVRAGGTLGHLEVLGRLVAVVAPETAHGAIVAMIDPASARPPATFGAMIVTLDPTLAIGATAAPLAHAAAGPGGLVFRAPTSGRYYGRPTPDKPPFLAVGAELATGATVCLLEVMKTFNRVTYGGPALPERARVRELLVIEGADVTAGDALIALDAI
jgi:acetyl-CoA carboxylase biotin carboxyl carrier protein